jgi:hypothetical protein
MSSRFPALLVAGISVAGMLVTMQQVSAAERAVLLVTSTECQIETISTLDIRKAYFGIGVSSERHSVRAFRLNSDAKLNQIFFQSVVAMSEKTYERRLLLLLVKYGRPRPREFESVNDLTAALNEVPCSIAYMWQHEVNEHAGIKVIKALWQEN